MKYPPAWKLAPGPVDTVLDGGDESKIAVRYFGGDLNFSDNPSGKSRPKMGLDEFMELAVHNESFQNVKHTELNGYNAYEIDFRGRVSKDGGVTYLESVEFAVMVESSKGEVIKIGFKDRPDKKSLTKTEHQILSAFKFIR